MAYTDVVSYTLSPEEIERLYGPVNKQVKKNRRGFNSVHIAPAEIKIPQPKPEKPSHFCKCGKIIDKKHNSCRECLIEANANRICKCGSKGHKAHGKCEKCYRTWYNKVKKPLTPSRQKLSAHKSYDCQIEGCTKGEKGKLWRGYCKNHYIQMRKRGYVRTHEDNGPCFCGKPFHAKGFCVIHYQRLLKYGDANLNKVMRPGGWVLIDERTGEKVEL